MHTLLTHFKRSHYSVKIVLFQNCTTFLLLLILIQGSGNVVEGTNGTSLLKIHTTDTDTRLTLAWRVRYSIQGDKGGHFSIHTDPETNDGIITVIKVCSHSVGYL